MTERPHPLDWAAPLLIGAAAAVAAEVAMGLLIYGGEGFIRSLTTVLAVEGMALGVGLWVAPGPGPELVDRLRRRWLLCIAAYVVATSFGVVWSVVPAVGTGATGQGLGLALLAAVPLFACGTVLGGMASVARSGVAGELRQPGAAAALGASMGFVLTGLLLPRAPIPASLLVGCLVLISGGGLVYGIVLSSRAGPVEADEEEPGVPEPHAT